LHSTFHIHLLLILPRPPTSTLFPYTTLFRSGRVAGAGVVNERLKTVGRVVLAEGVVKERFITVGRVVEAGGVAKERSPAVGRVVDRKSTRLNSSHRTISYAVFCLKKKTRTKK